MTTQQRQPNRKPAEAKGRQPAPKGKPKAGGAKPTFILGIGAQKAGTTFLHTALKAHPRVAMSHPKEMHVFDSYFLPQLSHFHEEQRRLQLISMLQANPSGLDEAERKRVAAQIRLCAMQYDLNEYLRYFRGLAARKGIRYVGDITPEYQLLSAVHFQEILELLDPHFDIKVVFLMRDPIERAYSAMKMADRNEKEAGAPAHERFAKNFRARRFSRSSRYESTLVALDRTFAPEQVYCGFYENLFQPDTFAQLASFLGLPDLTADFDEKVNASPATGRIDPATLAEAREFFAPTYDYCMERFGAQRIRKLWEHC